MHRTKVALLLFSLLFSVPAEARDVRPHAGMLRTPDASAESIVFVYADGLWVVPRAGGVASPLASPPGLAAFPRFSPDGETIAFVGNYDGGRDIYTVPKRGGVPHRVTHHPAAEILCGWTPDGELLYYKSGLGGLPRQTQLFRVSARGGLPEQLPVPYGASGAISPDGRWLAYTPHTTDMRTWKRYRGGMATDIWLLDLGDKSSRRVTDWEGTDTHPMWHGSLLYYVSDDGPSHRQNVWVYDLATGARSQITFFSEHDVKWPSIGPGDRGQGEIVFQLGAELRLLDLATRESRPVEVIVPGARPVLRSRPIDAARHVTSMAISPTGKRAVAAARGDVWTLPAKNGVPRNLSRTSGAFERDPAWSPDGRWIAYFSDETGEYELWMVQSDGAGERRRLTGDAAHFRYRPFWSPDSKLIGFFDKAGGMYLHRHEDGVTWLVDTDPMASYPSGMSPSWSHDSRWLAYSRNPGSVRSPSRIHLYDVEERRSHPVTSGMFDDTGPAFDRKGDYLYFSSKRSFRPMYGELESSFVYANTEVLLCVPLRADMPSPFAPKSDEEEWGDDEEEDEEDGEDSAADEAETTDEPADEEADEQAGDAEDSDAEEDSTPLVIDLEGFERRAVPLPVESGVFGNLAVNDKGQLLYQRRSVRGASGHASLHLFDVAADEPEEKSVAERADRYSISADGKKLLVAREGKWSIQDAAAGAKAEPVVTAGMTCWIEPREEWRQILRDTWRIQRDFFYVENLHGVDWDATWDTYAAMLPDCASREDVSYLIREMIAELNVGHAYYSGGDVGEEPRMTVGMLGADFELSEDAYRILQVHEGAPWDSDARGPLSQPGVDVKAGDYLLAVNGQPVDCEKDPWAAFQDLAGKSIRITVSSEPRIGPEAREVVVKALPSEADLRYRAWVEGRRAHVEARTDGRVGYLYVPNTGLQGQNELVRQYFSQLDKEGLIIDERWNGGGQIPTRFIELLNRPITNYWARRDGLDWPWPPDAHQGPKCMLINGLAGSGGDAFPAYFRQAGLGKLIGTRTWGGLVGISGNPGLVDGGSTTAPTFGYYSKDGNWSIEGHGVDPDIEVLDDPARMQDGADPQLDAAIDWILSELERAPYRPPARPAAPDRRGFGIDPAHH